MRSSKTVWGALATTLLTFATLTDAYAAEPPTLHVVVSVLPQQSFVARVGGEHVAVEALVGPGQSPHAYEPTARQVAALADAAVYFRTGVAFEAGIVPRIQRMFPALPIVDLRQGVPLRHFTTRESASHDHEHEHAEEHEHADDTHDDHAHETPAADPNLPRDDDHTVDPHIWLSPRLVKIQVATIAKTLARLDAAHADEYRANARKLQAELDTLHDELAKQLAPLKGRPVFVFHPAFGYFLDEFGLEQVPVEVEGKEPTARQLVTLIERAKRENVRVIFVQPQFAEKSAAALARAINGAVVAIDPLAEDELSNLRRIGAAVKAGLEKSAAE